MYNESKTEAVPEEEEHAGCRRDRGDNKEEQMEHSWVILSPLLLDRVLHNPQ